MGGRGLLSEGSQGGHSCDSLMPFSVHSQPESTHYDSLSKREVEVEFVGITVVMLLGATE